MTVHFNDPRIATQTYTDAFYGFGVRGTLTSGVNFRFSYLRGYAKIGVGRRLVAAADYDGGGDEWAVGGPLEIRFLSDQEGNTVFTNMLTAALRRTGLNGGPPNRDQPVSGNVTFSRSSSSVTVPPTNVTTGGAAFWNEVIGGVTPEPVISRSNTATTNTTNDPVVSGWSTPGADPIGDIGRLLDRMRWRFRPAVTPPTAEAVHIEPGPPGTRQAVLDAVRNLRIARADQREHLNPSNRRPRP